MTNDTALKLRRSLGRTASLVILFIGVLLFVLSWWAADFPDAMTYGAAAQDALEGQTIYEPFQLTGPYTLHQASNGDGFVYPPSALVLLLPFALGRPAWLVIDLVGAFGLTIVVLAIMRRETGRLSWPVAATTTGFLLVNYPMSDAMDAGQVTPFIAAGLGLAWLAPWTSGWTAAIGFLVKLYPGAIGVWAVRKRTDVVRPAILVIAALAVTTIWLGVGVWSDYVTAWRNGQPYCFVLSFGTFQCALGSPVGSLIGYAITALLLVGVWRMRRDDSGFALLSLSMIAPVPDLWPHYLLLPMVGFLPFALRVFQPIIGQPGHPSDGERLASPAPSSVTQL